MLVEYCLTGKEVYANETFRVRILRINEMYVT